MKLAAAEKTRLEEKQRAVRKYNEHNHIEHKTVYFDKLPEKVNGEDFWMYNHSYYERDRAN